MNFHIKQIVYIILISISFSIIRYFLIKGEYPLIKRSDISIATYASDSNLDSLKKYLFDITYPVIIDFNFAKKIHDNNLATFIDARDNESYNEGHIAGAINVSYDYVIEEIDYQYLKESLYEDLEYSDNQSDYLLLAIFSQLSLILNFGKFICITFLLCY